MKRLYQILALVIAMTVIMPAASIRTEAGVATVSAADNKTKAQKEKEKAKAQKQKAAAKAKAQKEKERAKAQAQKQKAQAQKQKEKEKAQALAQKQKAQAQKQKAQAAKAGKPAPKAEPELTPAEEKLRYNEEVASIERANARAEAYNTRDISHRLGFWGQVGYSNLFTSGISYDAAAGTGFMATDRGFVGGGAGLGYQLRYRQMLMTTGVEMQFYNGSLGVSNQPDGTLTRSFGMEPYADVMTYHYTFKNVRDHITGGFVQVPILFGMELRNVPLFWQAGLKAGLGLVSSSRIEGSLTTTITDEEIISGLEDMYSHTLVTDQAIDRPATKLNLGLNLAATAEVGLNFDPWINSKARLRLSLFADYGLLNVNGSSLAQGAQDLPMQFLVNPNPLDYPVNSALATTSAAGAQVHPFLVGAKLAVWFDLPRHEKELKDLPEPPTPRMGVALVDAETGAPLNGVAVAITNQQTGKTMRKNTNRQGLIQGRFAPGKYTVAATKTGYHPSEAVEQTVELFTFDTLRVALQRIEEPVVYTFCMNIYDAQTREPIEASARITGLKGKKVLYEGQSSDDGFIETPLTEGDYIAHLTAQGYMPKDDTIHFVTDTADIFMNPIKKGIKVKIENLFFATNKTYILPQSEQSMSELAQFLLENPGVTIHIVGHTDAVGTDEANQILSEGRANSVRANLIERGIAPERMTAEGKGETEPVADNDTDEGRQLNRRVEFTITGTNGADIEQIR